MSVIILDTSEVKALGRDITRNARRVESKTRAAITRGAFKVQGRAQVNAPVDTGALKNSITTSIEGLAFEVGPEVAYGGWVETGTSGPYPIPNAFGWGITVMHPGNSPEPYLGPAYDATLPDIVDEILGSADPLGV
jgi:HK97 gp10 family phage protein